MFLRLLLMLLQHVAQLVSACALFSCVFFVFAPVAAVEASNRKSFIQLSDCVILTISITPVL